MIAISGRVVAVVLAAGVLAGCASKPEREQSPVIYPGQVAPHCHDGQTSHPPPCDDVDQ